MFSQRNIAVTLAWLAGVVATGRAGTPPTPRYVSDRTVVLDFRLDESTEVMEAELWLSRDGGWCWEPVCVDRPTPTCLVFLAPHDGRFELYLALSGIDGPTLPPPEAGDSPHAAVVVDTLPPLIQLHGSPVVAMQQGVPHLRQRMSLIEENLGRGALRVFYRDAGGAWRDGGPARFDPTDRALDWSPPAGAHGAALRLIATDLAGNRAFAEIAAAPAGAVAATHVTEEVE
jgi:hypothetical protein